MFQTFVSILESADNGKGPYDGDDDDGSAIPEFNVHIYIILAVVPITIFIIRIIWAYVFRRRRQRRRAAERRSRRRQGNALDDDDGDTDSIASALAKPPPSYKDLFGGMGVNRSSVFAISGRNVPICQECKKTSCSVVKIINQHEHVNFLIDEAATTTSQSNSPLPSSTIISTTTTTTPEITTSSTPLTVTANNSNFTSSAIISFLSPNIGNASENASEMTSHPSVENSLSPQIIDSNVEIALELETYTKTDIPEPSHFAMENEIDPNNSRSKKINDSDSYNPEIVEYAVESEGMINNTHQDSGNIPASMEASYNTSTSTISSSSLSTTRSEEAIPHQEPILTPISSNEHSTDPIRRSPTLTRTMISDPCACACHRTIPVNVNNSLGQDNQAFQADGTTGATPTHAPDTSTQTPIISTHRPALHRVWSNLSTGSIITLSELPSYQDALEIIKKKEFGEPDELQETNNSK